MADLSNPPECGACAEIVFTGGSWGSSHTCKPVYFRCDRCGFVDAFPAGGLPASDDPCDRFMHVVNPSGSGICGGRFILVPSTPPVNICTICSSFCQIHGFQHGREAEELRKGIEHILELDGRMDLQYELRRLLDRVDARDSLAYLEQSDLVQEEMALTEAARDARDRTNASVAVVVMKANKGFSAVPLTRAEYDDFVLGKEHYNDPEELSKAVRSAIESMRRP